jgi:hypothetical protein
MNMITQLIEWHDTLRAKYMSRCRSCGSAGEVISYDPRGLWAYLFRRTYCPAHCPDHDYEYSRYDGHYCINCGQAPDPDWHDCE